MNKPPLFPTKLAELNLYFNTAAPYLTDDDNKVRLGISIGNTANLINRLAAWQFAMAKIADPNLRTKTSTAEKDAAGLALKTTLRAVYKDIPQSKLTDADRITLNLQERGAPTPAPEPTSCPVITVNTANRLRHSIRLTDQASAGKRAKPARVRGGQIWVFVGDAPPQSLDQYRYLGIDTRSPFIAEYDMADGGKTAYYISRWENTKGVTGPWSDVVAATIGA